MRFEFRGIEFDVGRGIVRPMAQDLYKTLVVSMPATVDVLNVEMENDDDEIIAYIYIDNDDEEEYSNGTAYFLERLSERNIDAFVSDEDYGGLDVVIVTFRADVQEMVQEMWKLEAHERAFHNYRSYPRAETPYSKELARLHRILMED